MPERISDRIRMSQYIPERMPYRMSECICIYIYMCVPYIFPDGMSETRSEYIECQGGDRSKKVCFSWHILTLTHPHFEKNLCLSDLAAQATICNSRHLMSCRNSPVTAVEARSSFTNLWLLPKWSMQPCTCEKLKESSFTLDSIDWFPKKMTRNHGFYPQI